MHEFDTKDLQRLFGIPPSQVRSLIRAGHIQPLKKSGRLSYSFQDLIVLRTAGSLRAAKIPAHKINRTLQQIRASLPGSLPLSGLSIVAIGDRIVVREGQALRDSDTGQYALALEFTDKGGDILVIDKRSGTPTVDPPFDPSDLPADQFERALALEGSDAEAAQAAYEACLAADAHHLEARLNLGRLLHIGGRLQEAEEIYRGTDVAEAILSYNLAVLLEDLERESEAMTAYREALALDQASPTRTSISRASTSGQTDRKMPCVILLAYRRV